MHEKTVSFKVTSLQTELNAYTWRLVKEHKQASFVVSREYTITGHYYMHESKHAYQEYGRSLCIFFYYGTIYEARVRFR